MRSLCKVAVALAAAAVGSASFGQVQINEFLVNPPGTDNGSEFFELIGPPSYDLTGLTLLVIEGDGGNKGTIDQALSLDGKSIGTNGLFLWRDGGTPLQPLPEAATTIFVQDFSPDIENGSNTYLLVRFFTGTVGQDIDTDNDGVIELPPFDGVLDAMGYVENGTDGVQYATQFGGVNGTDPTAPPDGFTPDSLSRLCGAVLSQDVIGAFPGPWFNDAIDTRWVPDNGQSLELTYTLTPGSANAGAVCGGGPACDSDFNGDGNSDQDDVACLIDVVAGNPGCQAQDPDFNRDGNVDQDDVAALINVVAGGACP